MGFIWFSLVAIMIVAYVVLDGFDLGVGIMQHLLARTDLDRQIMLRSIGPVWDGNEVWLIAGGGTLYFAFPLLYASAFSGFYLALMIVLWLLILRALSIELRMQVELKVWRTFFDGLFFLSSLLLAVIFGAALGNVIRGVPLGEDGYFFLPLWTNFRVGPHPGILDWYTLIGSLLALAALSLHGALYLAVKTEGPLQQGSRASAQRLWIVVLVLTIASLPTTIIVRPDTLANYFSSPVLFAVPVAVLIALAGVIYFGRKQDDRKSFACSCLYLTFMLVGAAIALYPRLLPSSDHPGLDITVSKAIAGPYAVRVGLWWWAFGICLAITYFVIVYRMFRGKITATSDAHGD